MSLIFTAIVIFIRYPQLVAEAGRGDWILTGDRGGYIFSSDRAASMAVIHQTKTFMAEATVGSNPGAYYGGDFQGIIDKLDYLKDLGINTIWISPIVDNIDWGVL